MNENCIGKERQGEVRKGKERREGGDERKGKER